MGDVYFEARDLCAELEKYAELEGTELGDACYDLMRLVSSMDMFTDEFNQAIYKEIKHQLKEFKKYTKIVEHFDETVTYRNGEEVGRHARTIKELEFVEDAGYS